MTLSWNETQAEALALAGEDLLLLDQVKLLLGRGATPVDCIKALRQIHGLGLAAGKDLVDSALNPESRLANEELRESLAEEMNAWDDC
jgi:ribosomal protein L7/L12